MSQAPSFRVPSRSVVLGIVLLGGAISLAAETENERLTSRRQPSAPPEKGVEVGTEVRTAAGQRQRLVLPDGSVLYVNEKTSLKLAAKQRLTLTTGEVFIEASGKDGAEPLVVHTARRTISGRSARFAVLVGEDGTAVLVAGGQVKIGDTSLRAGQQLPATSDKPAAAARAAQQLDWTRDLQATAETPLVPGSAFTGGALIAIDPDGQEMKLALRKYHIDVHVEDGFARTTIDQTYFNQEAQRLEGTFYFPLPPDASLSRLAMYVDGTLMEGGMAERDYARNVYEEIVYRQKDPALLEWVDGSTFKMRVFPLEPRQEKRIILSYSQRLPAQHGRQTYRFPAGHNLGVVQDWSFHARVKDGAGLTWNAASHNVKSRADGGDLLLDAAAKGVKLDRDVVVTLADKDAADGEQVRFSSAELDGAKYLMLRYRPGTGGLTAPARQGTAPARRDWVFLFESSGDRDPLLARAQIEVIRGLLAHAGPEDTFAVLAAGTRIHALAREAQPVTPASVVAAVAFLENVHLIGALDLEKALTEAAPLLKAAKEPHLIHVGSGIAALGEQRTDKLVAMLPQATRYVGIGVGRRWGRGFMKSAAEKTGGAFTQINPDEPVSWRTFELAASLDAPRLFNIQVKASRGASAPGSLLTESIAIAQGEEICAFLRTDGDLPDSVTVTGTVGGKPFERTLPVKDVRASAGYLPRTWARLEIDRLLAENPVKHKEQIVALSKALYVMSPFTSLLVLENEEMYVRYKVDRGRKDHWALYPCPAKVPVVYEPLPGMPADARNLEKDQKPNARQVLNTICGSEKPNKWMLGLSLDDAPAGSRSSNPSLVTQQFAPLSFVNSSDYKIKLELPGAQRLYKLESAAALDARLLAQRSRQDMFGTGVNGAQSTTGSIVSPVATASQVFIVGNDVTRQNVILRQIPLDSDVPPPQGHYLQHQPRNSPASPPFPLSRELANMSGVPAPANRRMGELLNTSENLQTIQDQWERIWFIDQPSHLTPDRVHGGITPGQGNLVPGDDQPAATADDRAFFDLVAYCPGMTPIWADVQAVIDAEAAPDKASIPGRIDDGARKLIDRARSAGWQTLTFPARNGQPALTIRFDGQGRYAWERTLPPGLRERVVCDGQTILHIYPDLGIGARRTVGRAHRLAWSGTVPWFVPPADDLARGTDVKLLDERTVAVQASEERRARGGRKSPGEARDTGESRTTQLRLVFAADGALAERQLVEMPSGKVLARQVLGSRRHGQAARRRRQGESGAQMAACRRCRPRADQRHQGSGGPAAALSHRGARQRVDQEREEGRRAAPPGARPAAAGGGIWPGQCECRQPGLPRSLL